MPARDRTRPRWSKWFWKDWLAKTQDMSAEARSGYLDLMAYAVTNSPDFCSVPNDEKILPYAARLRPERWRVVRSQVLLTRWQLRADNRWEHPRLAEDAARWSNYIDNIKSGTPRGTPKGTPKAPVVMAGGGSTQGKLGTCPDAKFIDSTKSGTRDRGIARVLTSGVGVTESVEAEETEPSTNGKGKAEDSGSAGGTPRGKQERLPGFRSEKEEWLQAFDEDFYPAYPRKVKPDRARRAWLSVKPWTQENCDLVFAGLEKWVRYWRDHETAKEYIPYPSVFLNDGQWKGEPG